MIDAIHLTPAVTGLGDLTEPALLAVIADAHYRSLTRGTELSPRRIANKAGEPLYPSVFALHVRVPAQRLISSHTLWERFDVGVDIRTFGRQFLEVNGVIGRHGEVPDALDAWKDLSLPHVTWSGAWTVTRPGGEHELSMPDSQYIADLPRLPKVPAAIAAAREASMRGSIGAVSGRTASGPPIAYPVLAGRDAAPGRQMMFSQFVVVLDAVERTYLAERICPVFPVDVLDGLATIERKLFYFGNCGAGDVVEAYVSAVLERVAPPDGATTRGAALVSSIELVHVRTGRLLALAETRKLLALSSSDAGALQQAERLFSRHGEATPLTEIRR